MKHRCVSVLCPDKMCKPDNIKAELHFFDIQNHFLRRRETFVTLICPHHQKPYADMSRTTFWNKDIVKRLCEVFDKGYRYKICTQKINDEFNLNLPIQKRPNNKGWRGPVVKKMEHLREMKVLWKEDDSDDKLRALYHSACRKANMDHKKRTNYWNKFRKVKK